MNYNQFGAYLTFIREQRGQTYNDVANGTGIPVEVIVKLENGEMIPTNITITAISQFFGISSDDIKACRITPNSYISVQDNSATQASQTDKKTKKRIFHATRIFCIVLSSLFLISSILLFLYSTFSTVNNDYTKRQTSPAPIIGRTLIYTDKDRIYVFIEKFCTANVYSNSGDFLFSFSGPDAIKDDAYMFIYNDNIYISASDGTLIRFNKDGNYLGEAGIDDNGTIILYSKITGERRFIQADSNGIVAYFDDNALLFCSYTDDTLYLNSGDKTAPYCKAEYVSDSYYFPITTKGTYESYENFSSSDMTGNSYYTRDGTLEKRDYALNRTYTIAITPKLVCLAYSQPFAIILFVFSLLVLLISIFAANKKQKHFESVKTI